jgi:uncharacterized protein YyaL (SSP411 family)
MDLLSGNPEFTEEAISHIGTTFVGTLDTKWGGRKGAPKFPMPNNSQFLLKYSVLMDDARANEAVLTTLDKMANGGIFDQLGGGFSRYSVDARWHVPHFEKMLYDNGQIVSVYAQVFQLTKDPLYARVIRETLAFIERELTDSSGGFYSSLDADSDGEEGKFYVWTENEIEELFPDVIERKVVSEYFDIKSNGNWEHGKNVLQVLNSTEEIAEKNEISPVRCAQIIEQARTKMFQAREKRMRPGLDDKILTSWNALMLKGYTDAYRALQDQQYLTIALKNATFIETQMLRDDGGLNRNYKDGRSAINAFLDDYALVIDAWLALYQVTFEERWLHSARRLADYAIAHFYDASSGMFYYTSDLDPPLVARKKELSDNVIPASNSVFAKDLHKLGQYFYHQEYLDLAAQMLHNMSQVSIHIGVTSTWTMQNHNMKSRLWEKMQLR